jgi:hypothetical protein
MKYIALLLISSSIFCQTITSSKYPFSINLPKSWQTREAIPKTDNNFEIALYSSSPNRFLYNMARMHREFVYVAVKKNTKPYDGVITDADRENRLKELQINHRKRKESALVKVKQMKEYEENGLHHLLFESQMPAYNQNVYNIIHHVFDKEYTYILFGMFVVDDFFDENKQLVTNIQNSFTL